MVKIYTEIQINKQNGSGGFGLVIFDDDVLMYCYRDFSKKTDKEREDLKSALHALKMVKERYECIDSQIYLTYAHTVGICDGWCIKWKNDNWKNHLKKRVLNVDILRELYKYLTMDLFNYKVSKYEEELSEEDTFRRKLAKALAKNNIEKFYKMIETYNIKVDTFCKI